MGPRTGHKLNAPLEAGLRTNNAGRQDSIGVPLRQGNQGIGHFLHTKAVAFFSLRKATSRQGRRGRRIPHTEKCLGDGCGRGRVGWQRRGGRPRRSRPRDAGRWNIRGRGNTGCTHDQNESHSAANTKHRLIHRVHSNRCGAQAGLQGQGQRCYASISLSSTFRTWSSLTGPKNFGFPLMKMPSATPYWAMTSLLAGISLTTTRSPNS